MRRIMPALRRNILFVDDDPMARALITSMLTQAGYVVTCAENGFAALEDLYNYPFDLLLLDIMMTKMNGLDLLKRIKAQEETKDIPVIMVSARHDQKIITRAIQAGALDYIIKPPARDVTLRKIETALGGRPRFAEVNVDMTSPKGACQFI